MKEYTILNHLQFSNPTKEQESALKAMQDFVSPGSNDNVMVLCGAAGTGKTSIINALVSYLNSNEKEYIIAAPTGRAARIISRKTNASSATLHSTIYNTSTDDNTGQVICTLKDTVYEHAQVFIIDESSMIPSIKASDKDAFKANDSLLGDLIKFIKKSHKENKVIFLGDTYQLPPINEEQPKALSIDYLTKTYGFTGSEYFLTEVKRQSDGSMILNVATNIRKDIDQNTNSNHIIKIPSTYIDKAIQSYMSDIEKFGLGHSQAIAVSHADNFSFNHRVRMIQHGGNPPLIKNGDMLIIHSNWKRGELALYNGDNVMVMDVDINKVENVAGINFVPIMLRTIDEKKTEIQDYIMLDCFSTKGGNIPHEKLKILIADRMAKNPTFRETRFPWDDKYIGAIRAIHGHSITCNKAQGGEWSKVYIKKGWLPSLKWGYTAVTRAAENINLYI